MESGPRKQSLDLITGLWLWLTKAGRLATPSLGEALSALRVVHVRKVTLRTSLLWLKTRIPVKIINVLSRQNIQLHQPLDPNRNEKVGHFSRGVFLRLEQMHPWALHSGWNRGSSCCWGDSAEGVSQMSTETCHLLGVYPQGPPLVPLTILSTAWTCTMSLLSRSLCGAQPAPAEGAVYPAAGFRWALIWLAPVHPGDGLHSLPLKPQFELGALCFSLAPLSAHGNFTARAGSVCLSYTPYAT